jgi:hypothetical protein
MKRRIKLPNGSEFEYASVRFKRIRLYLLNEVKPFLKVLRKRYETLIWIFTNGDVYLFTNHKEKVVSVGTNDFMLKEIGREAKDIAVIYHNHQSYEQFSSCDLRSFLELRRMGFEGRYCLYVVKANHLIETDEREANVLLHKLEAYYFLKRHGLV